jgi:hypothetical protein
MFLGRYCLMFNENIMIENQKLKNTDKEMSGE